MLRTDPMLGSDATCGQVLTQESQDSVRSFFSVDSVVVVPNQNELSKMEAFDK